jgi:hypothetical protein
LAETQTSEWFETLSDAERHDCAADLTDAYFAALNHGRWNEFCAQVRQWQERAEQRELVTV